MIGMHFPAVHLVLLQVVQTKLEMVYNYFSKCSILYVHTTLDQLMSIFNLRLKMFNS